MFKFINDIYTTIKNVVYDIITEEKQNGNGRKVSIGRIAFIVVLIASLHIWLTSVPMVDVPPNMFLTLTALLTYVLGTKALSSWTTLQSMKLNGNGETKTTSTK